MRRPTAQTPHGLNVPRTFVLYVHSRCVCLPTITTVWAVCRLLVCPARDPPKHPVPAGHSCHYTVCKQLCSSGPLVFHLQVRSKVDLVFCWLDVSVFSECRSSECEACFSRDFCTKCKPGLLLHKGKCLTSCPEGTFVHQTDCHGESCKKPCSYGVSEFIFFYISFLISACHCCKLTRGLENLQWTPANKHHMVWALSHMIALCDTCIFVSTKTCVNLRLA